MTTTTVLKLLRPAATLFIVLLALVAPLQTRAISPGAPAFERTWSRTDLPVASGAVSRTWMWGPSAFTSPMVEWMTSNPGNGRLVQYFDKSRMEITDPNADPSAVWFVTNGLLAQELVSGRLQRGLDDFEQREPAGINVAGDSIDANAPTYASFQNVLNAAPLAEGTTITTRIDRGGNVTEDPALAGQGITATEFVPETNHRVAAPFWAFMTSTGTVYENGVNGTAALFESPFFATGLPISEAYWTTVAVNGVAQDVLVQVFERRVLTFTPNNAPEWQVEAGNVGRHYFEWRYGTEPPAEPPTAVVGAAPIGPAPLPSLFQNNDQSRLTVANHAPQPLTVTISGPVLRTIELAACDGCQSTSQPPAVCSPDAPSATIDVPPGSYLLTSQRPGSDITPLSGPWTVVPNAGYGACFFVITTG